MCIGEQLHKQAGIELLKGNSWRLAAVDISAEDESVGIHGVPVFLLFSFSFVLVC
jgi:hypothetical protein